MLPPGSQFSGHLSKLFDRFVAKRVTLPDSVTRSSRPEPFRASRTVGSVYMPDGTALVNGVSARFGLEIAFTRPGRALRKINCPTLVCICDRDSVAPPRRTTKFVKRARDVESRHYDAGHFDIYVGERFERVVTDQIEFLQRVLG
jgi:pimeloyl-ACP methyl ester carboxylesterase